MIKPVLVIIDLYRKHAKTLKDLRIKILAIFHAIFTFFVKNNDAVAMAIALFYAATHELTFRITFLYKNISFSSYVPLKIKIN